MMSQLSSGSGALPAGVCGLSAGLTRRTGMSGGLERGANAPADAAPEDLVERGLLPAAALQLRIFVHQRLHVVPAARVSERAVQHLSAAMALAIQHGTR